MPDRPASWRMPTSKQMEKMAAATGRNTPPAPGLAPDQDLPVEYWQALLDDARADGSPPVSGSSSPEAAKPNSSAYSEVELRPLRQDRRDPEGGRRQAVRAGCDLEG